ncbi:MAG TPA: PQQ-binding-like beta-propeller repeat protein [Capsulimonadaceae bacterium]|nr:PQQ-binding-like beta-propeller repeat protein [Capsulimonadaceae bacterium]
MKTTIHRWSIAMVMGLSLFCALLVAAQAQSATTGGPASGNIDTYRGGPGHNGYVGVKLPTNLAVRWQNTTTPQPNNSSSPACVDGVLYFGSGNHVYAVNAKDGTLKWQFPKAEVDQSGVALPGPFNGPATVYNGRVYIGGDDNKLYVLDAGTGESQWQFATGGAVRGAPLIDNGAVFFGGTDNHLYAVRLDNQQPLWGGQFRTNGSVTAAPMVANGILFFSDDDTVYGVSEDSGRPLWSSRQIGGMTAPPMLDNGTIYVGVGRTLEAIISRSGSSRWTSTLPSEPSAAATAGGSEGLVYIPSTDQNLYALDARGNIRWKSNLHDLVSAPPVLTDSMLVVATRAGALYGLDPHSGAVNWVYSLRPAKSTADAASSKTSVSAAPVAAGGNLYVLSDDGTLSAFSGDAPDTVPPTVVSTYPSSSDAISGVNIPYQITVHDFGSGIRPDSVSLQVDGKAIPVEYDPINDLIQVKAQTLSSGSILGRAQVTLPTLGGGPHTAVLTLTDWRGNKLVRRWAFLVDSSLNPPESTISAPGTVQNNSQGNNGSVGDQDNMTPNDGVPGAPSGGARGTGRNGGGSGGGSGRGNPNGGGGGTNGGGGAGGGGGNQGGGGGTIGGGTNVPPPPPL